MIPSRVLGRIGLSLWLAACASNAGGPTRALPPKSSPLEEPRFAEIVERSMPAVVLILNTQSDGTQIYGAGLLVDRGLALTSQHVVANAKALGAVLYSAHRTSYTPMDGGLSRYLFENQSSIVKARV